MVGLLEAKEKVIRNFNFLKSDYSFKGPFEWNIAYEKEYTYVNEMYYVNIGFDGGFFVSVGITTKLFPKLSTGQLTLNDVSYEDRKSLDPINLLSKKERVEFLKIKNPMDQLSFQAKLIKDNPEILHGDWYKASIKYRMIKYITTLFSKIVRISTESLIEK